MSLLRKVKKCFLSWFRKIKKVIPELTQETKNILHELAQRGQDRSGQVISGQVWTGLLALPDLAHETKKSYLSWFRKRKNTKGRVQKLNKLFSQNFLGIGGGIPPIRENNKFFPPKNAKKTKYALKHVKK